jgi:uncharacterized protein
VILWGTSFSGGHVLQLAARHDDLAAVISQLPHVSGLATIVKVHPRTLIKTTCAALIDLVAGSFNRTFYSRVIGEPGQCAAVTSDSAVEAYRKMLPPDISWENKVLARSFLQIPLYTPRKDAQRITAPTLVIAARRDSVVPASATRRAARKIPNCTFHSIDGDHFEPYFDECFEENIRLQLEFLREHVPPHARASG